MEVYGLAVVVTFASIACGIFLVNSTSVHSL